MDSATYKRDVARRLRMAIEALGISQAQVCRDLGVSASKLGNWIGNSRVKGHYPDPWFVRRFCDRYNITADWIYRERIEAAMASSVAGALWAAACGGFQKPASDANYGPPPAPSEYEDRVRSIIADQLIDPESARFRFSTPLKAYGNAGLIYGGHVSFVGYVIPVAVNAKNRLGGYVGFGPWFCGFQAGEVRDCMSGDYRMYPLVTLVP